MKTRMIGHIGVSGSLLFIYLFIFDGVSNDLGAGFIFWCISILLSLFHFFPVKSKFIDVNLPCYVYG